MRSLLISRRAPARTQTSPDPLALRLVSRYMWLRGSPKPNRHSLAACNGSIKMVLRTPPDEISILRWLEMGPENFFRGSPTRNRNFSGCQRNSPVAPESDRRVFLEEVWAGIANSPVSPHLAIIILKGRMEEPENRDSTQYFLQKHSPVASLSDRRIRGLVSATLYRGPGA